MIRVRRVWRSYASAKLEKIFGSEMVEFAENRKPYTLPNLIEGRWIVPAQGQKTKTLLNPLDGKPSFNVAQLSENDISAIKSSIQSCPKSGLFNPLKKPFMYRKWGEILFRLAHSLHDKEIEAFMKRLMFLCIPKTDSEASKELLVARQGIENFSGDNPRFALRGFTVAGDREGQESVGYRFPYGPTALITPFNFPLEIPALQLIGALISGNKVIVKSDVRGAPVVEGFVRLLQHSGMPEESIALVNADRDCAAKLFEECKDIIRLVQFTGSSQVAHKLLEQFSGRVKLEDSGFNWKILGPDVLMPDYVVSQTDQDAFATSGQKCSCLRILLVHKNWAKAGFMDKLVARVSKRNIQDLTISPLISVTNEQAESRIAELLKIPGAKIITGGKRVQEKHSTPPNYGLFEPTIVSIPFEQISKKENGELVFKELFGPLLIVTEYTDSDLDKIIDITERIPFHLTASIVSNEPTFINHLAKNTVNGVTYVGIKGRTTGAPQNHYFGPSNDPRAAGIGTIEAIINTWTCHREVVYDFGTLGEENNTLPQS